MPTRTIKKPATKKPATKKPATKKPATKKPATKKPAAKPRASAVAELPSRSLEHGEHASGAKYLRRGFARDPKLDLAFALGYGGGGIGPIRLLPDLDPS